MTQRGRGRPPHPGILTAAEERVLEELRRGGTNAEIAARLGVTLDAVKFHISNMLGKLQLENREQLAAWRPEPRRRLFGLLALPGALEPVGRVLVWAGVAVAGAAAVAVVAVVLIVLAGVDGSEQQLALAPTATPTPTATATPPATAMATARPAPTATATPTPTAMPTPTVPTFIPPAPPTPLISFGDGEVRVGVDVPPGVYRSVPLAAECAWERQIEGGQRVHGSLTLPEGIARIYPTDVAFFSQGCGTWTNALFIPPGQPFGDGVWFVGAEVPPGRYRATGASDDCWWELNDAVFTDPGPPLSHGRSHVRVAGWDPVVSVVDIDPSEHAFSSSGCGTWTTDLTPLVTPGEPFGDGTFLVGSELAPGRYRASGSPDSCRWDLWDSALRGSDPPTREYHIGDRTIVDIGPDDEALASQGCGTWSADLTPTVRPGELFGDGTFLVGSEIAPGRYSTTSATDECWWERLRDFASWSRIVEAPSVIEHGRPRGGGIVEIALTDVGFHSRGCGTWTPVPPYPTPTSRGAAPVGCLATTDRTAADRQTEERRWRPVPSTACACSSSRRSPRGRTAASTSPTSAPT